MNSTFSSSEKGFSKSSLVRFLAAESLGCSALLFGVRKIRSTRLSAVSDSFKIHPPEANRSRTPDSVAPSRTSFLPISLAEIPSSRHKVFKNQMLDRRQAIGIQPFFEVPVGFLVSFGKKKYDAIVISFHNNYFVYKLIEKLSVCQEK